jgi:hypothetical protein
MSMLLSIVMTIVLLGTFACIGLTVWHSVPDQFWSRSEWNHRRRSRGTK